MVTELVERVEEWSTERGLAKADPLVQSVKLGEEYGELCRALLRENQKDAEDAIGDMFVVLSIMAQQLGTSLEKCAVLAWSEIKDRQGRMVGGTFVKNSDLEGKE